MHKFQLSAEASANQLEPASIRLSFLLSFPFAIALLDGAKIGPQQAQETPSREWAQQTPALICRYRRDGR